MMAFHSEREAKKFLISKIVAEADSENVPLSEVERKMLYFSESGWTLPDIIKVNEDFDREYDQDEYEHKITKLVTNAYRRISKGSRDEYERWWASIRLLEKKDHYLLVMIQSAALRPRGDQLKLFATGLGIVALLIAWDFISPKYNVPVPSRDFLWVVVAGLSVAYLLLRFIFGTKKTDEVASKVLERIARILARE